MRTATECQDFCKQQWEETGAVVTELHLSLDSIKSIAHSLPGYDDMQGLRKLAGIINPMNGQLVKLVPIDEYAITTCPGTHTVKLP